MLGIVTFIKNEYLPFSAFYGFASTSFTNVIKSFSWSLIYIALIKKLKDIFLVRKRKLALKALIMIMIKMALII
jgi:hypothetical protein